MEKILSNYVGFPFTGLTVYLEEESFCFTNFHLSIASLSPLRKGTHFQKSSTPKFCRILPISLQ